MAKTGNKVKANKMIKLNNQSIYNSNLNRFGRNIVMHNMHEYLKAEIQPLLHKEILPGTFPIKIKFTFETVINHGSISMRSGKLCWKPAEPDYVPTWDIENLATIWTKAIADTLTMLKIIPDDNVEYVSGISYEFVPIEKLEERQITIEL